MRNRFPTLLSVGAIALLASCATSTAPVDQAAANLATDSLPGGPVNWASVADAAGPVTIGWLDAFGDPVLSALVSEAQSNNLNLQAASNNLERSRLLVQQAGAALTPSLGVSGGASRGGAIEGSSAPSYSLGLQTSWELDVWGRIRSGQRASLASAQAVEADYRFAQESLAAGVTRSYFLVKAAAEQESIANESLEAITETNRIVGVQFENGAATGQDVALAKADLATAQDGLAVARNSKRGAVRSLELLLGRYPSAELAVEGDLPTVPSAPPAGLPAQILERRPDLVAAERRIASSISGLNQAKAARLPSISLTGSLGGASGDLSNLLDPKNVAWSAASSLLMPIIDGGARQAQVDLAGTEQNAAVNAYAQAALSAFGEVEGALDLGMTLRERRQFLQSSQTEALEAQRIAQLRFEEGETDLLSVLSILQRVLSARTSLLGVHRDQLGQFIDLNLALGGSWQDAR